MALEKYRVLSSTRDTEHAKRVDTLVCMNMVKMQGSNATYALQTPQRLNAKRQLYLSILVKRTLFYFCFAFKNENVTMLERVNISGPEVYAQLCESINTFSWAP
jgi:hypothetical protein